jgi:hypothetical protein
MDSLAEVVSSVSQVSPAALSTQYDPEAESDALVLEASLGAADSTDQVDTNFEDLYKGLTIAAKKVIDKLNELLQTQLPQGIQSLKPEEVTSEATADRIVTGATSYFDIFAKQHPNLQGDELLDKFMETIRGGIQQGYDSASKTLEDIGAFQFDGVKQGIEETKALVEQKLQAYESYMREKLGLTDPVASNTEQAILTQAGANALSVAA